MSGLTAKCVVVPVDFSPESLAAIDTAIKAAESPSKVHVVHVIPELNIGEPGVVWQEIDNEIRSQHVIQALRERLTAEKYRDVKIDVEVGDPSYRIADFAKRTGADLIVVPSQGRTGLSHILIGSVAERVVRLSHCPVLVLRS